jgi:hypothetical protein
MPAPLFGTRGSQVQILPLRLKNQVLNNRRFLSGTDTAQFQALAVCFLLNASAARFW